MATCAKVNNQLDGEGMVNRQPEDEEAGDVTKHTTHCASYVPTRFFNMSLPTRYETRGGRESTRSDLCEDIRRTFKHPGTIPALIGNKIIGKQ